LPALIRKFHTAKLNGDASVEVWGTGAPLREFLHVNDLADACYHLMMHYNEKLFVNIGTGVDLSIKALAELVQKIVGFEGSIHWNTDKPDGTPRKLMDVSRIERFGWRHAILLEEGIRSVYEDFKMKELSELRAK
jgi:GDP-L-fucose synthase